LVILLDSSLHYVAVGMTSISGVRGRNLTKLPTYFLHVT